MWGREITAPRRTEATIGWIAPWFDSTVSEVNGLTNLRPDWDSYGGSAVTRQVAGFVLDFLRQVIPDEESIPRVVPSPDGGISLEWHRPWAELVVEVPPQGHPSVFYSNERSGENWERDLSMALWDFDVTLKAVTAA
jgi:hypothetical protein